MELETNMQYLNIRLSQSLHDVHTVFFLSEVTMICALFLVDEWPIETLHI